MLNRWTGVRIYSGDTQYGKTTLAEKHALEANDAGQPFLVIDRMPAKNWIGQEHVNDREEVLRRLYGKPTGEVDDQGVEISAPPENVICSPRSSEDLDWILGKVHLAGTLGAPRTVLWDECSLDQSPWTISDEASQALRGWAHSGNLYLLVTQRFHELHGVIYVTTPSIRVFHTEHEKSLQRIKDELRLDVEKIRTLPVGEFEIYGRDK